MKLALQVFHPVGEGLSFDYDHYASTHRDLVQLKLAPDVAAMQFLRPMPGFEGATPPYFAITTLTFADNAAFQRAQAKLDPVGADIPNYYNGEPVLIVSEVLA